MVNRMFLNNFSAKGLLGRLVFLSYRAKRVLLFFVDTFLLSASLLLAFALRLDGFSAWLEKDTWVLTALAVLFGIASFSYFGVYRVVVRFVSQKMLPTIVAGCVCASLLLSLGAYFLQLWMPRSVPVLFTLLAVVFISMSRLAARFLLGGGHGQPRQRVAIYGAGASGQQLASMLNHGAEYEPFCFLDDDSELWGRDVIGLRVFNPDENSVKELVNKGVRTVLLAMPSATRGERRRVLQWLEVLPFTVRTVPGIDTILTGDARLDQLQDVSVDDLLGRDSVKPSETLLSSCINRKTVLVSGAGGSIGSELCRQVLKQGAKRILLLESSEFALYAIDAELRAFAQEGVSVFPLLGNVCDRKRVKQILAKFQVDTIYHAAAYKHVPLVEYNPLQGIVNNTFGTRILAEEACASNVSHFVLISTDKAVRPTNVMGASKRVAEVVLQALNEQGCNTIFSMVRFGNVLGSSGSVVPLFRSQIEEGGPVTVTHPEITRFFMTIPEAVELVIQAGAMSNGGDVFVLDMGEPVKIVDLARRMIHLSGREVKDEGHPEGDIEVVYTGLRPGEKLYEELLIGDNVSGTEHPKIMRAQEEHPSWQALQVWLQEMERAIADNDLQRVRDLLNEAVGGYQPQCEIADLVWQASPDLLH